MTQNGKEKRIKICLTKLNNIVAKYNITETEFNQIISDPKSVKRLDSNTVYSIRKNYKQLKDLA